MTNFWDRIPALHVVREFVLAAPLPILSQVTLRTINALRPGLQTLITAGFVNALIQRTGVLRWAAAYGAVALIELITDLLNDTVNEWVRSTAIMRIQKHVLMHVSGVPLARHLDPSFHDSVTRATHDLPDRVLRWFDSLMYLLNSGVATIGLISAVLALGGGGGIAAAILASSVVRLMCQAPLVKIDLAQSRLLARPQRQKEALARLLCSRTAAPEIRLFMAQPWIERLWQKAYRQCATQEIKAAKARSVWNGFGVGAGIASFGAIAALAIMAGRHAGPNQSVGTFTGLLLASQNMQAYMHEVLNSLGRLRSSASIIADLGSFLVSAPDAEIPSARATLATGSISLENVSFRYPRAQSDAICGVSARIGAGEVVALVGPNGAGKSTLAALLLNLYQPTGGSIAFGDADGYSGPRGNAVFQQFSRYNLTIRDNVGFGDIGEIADDRAIAVALDKAGSSTFDGPDTWLGPEFGGRDISGGEWLRIAIARGIFSRNGLMVLDEPTAAIDPVAEVTLAERLVELSRGATVVIVSHRLGIARMADRIMVMDNGRVIEQGSHDSLLAAGGFYAAMWRSQASWYVEKAWAGSTDGAS